MKIDLKTMIKTTIKLLKTAKAENWKGEAIEIALGKYKLPQTLKELTYKILK